VGGRLGVAGAPAAHAREAVRGIAARAQVQVTVADRAAALDRFLGEREEQRAIADRPRRAGGEEGLDLFRAFAVGARAGRPRGEILDRRVDVTNGAIGQSPPLQQRAPLRTALLGRQAFDERQRPRQQGDRFAVGVARQRRSRRRAQIVDRAHGVAAVFEMHGQLRRGLVARQALEPLADAAVQAQRARGRHALREDALIEAVHEVVAGADVASRQLDHAAGADPLVLSRQLLAALLDRRRIGLERRRASAAENSKRASAAASNRATSSAAKRSICRSTIWRTPSGSAAATASKPPAATSGAAAERLAASSSSTTITMNSALPSVRWCTTSASRGGAGPAMRALRYASTSSAASRSSANSLPCRCWIRRCFRSLTGCRRESYRPADRCRAPAGAPAHCVAPGAQARRASTDRSSAGRRASGPAAFPPPAIPAAR
jgi:hypothetical protein